MKKIKVMTPIITIKNYPPNKSNKLKIKLNLYEKCLSAIIIFKIIPRDKKKIIIKLNL